MLGICLNTKFAIRVGQDTSIKAKHASQENFHWRKAAKNADSIPEWNDCSLNICSQKCQTFRNYLRTKGVMSIPIAFLVLRIVKKRWRSKTFSLSWQNFECIIRMSSQSACRYISSQSKDLLNSIRMQFESISSEIQTTFMTVLWWWSH